MRAVINENRQLTLRELEDLGIPRDIVSEILMEDLGKKLAAKFLQLLSQQQKELHAEVAQDLLETT